MNKRFEETSIVKMMLFLFIFLVVCILLVAFLLVPNIKQYKYVKIINDKNAFNLSKIKNIEAIQENEFNEFKSQNIKIFKAMKNTFNEDKFIKMASNYFDDVKLKKLPKIDKKENFLRYELKVVGDIHKPQNFYDFIDLVNKYENIIKIDFPIELTGTGPFISTSFNIKVFLER